MLVSLVDLLISNLVRIFPNSSDVQANAALSLAIQALLLRT